MPQQVLLWVGFNLFILILLAFDLGIFHRRSHRITFREALVWSGVWIALALSFNAAIYLWRGPQVALEFLTGYLIEKSLSVDNIFVFLLIFSYFRVPEQYQHKVLFWGILGALILRALFIVTGVALLRQFHAVIYLFGALLIITGIRLALEKDKEVHPERNPVLRLFRRLMPVSHHAPDGRFFLRQGGRLMATPLFVVLLVVETTDVIFAVDSIPAILAITQDPFIVYTSNVFAILGLRALYFVVADMLRSFHHLHHGLAVILVFVGLKMLCSDVVEIPIGLSLAVVACTLLLSVIASLVWPRKS